ncbi:MAG: DUF1667 domain-containing protein [Cellulosilyticaceae bacterium]
MMDMEMICINCPMGCMMEVHSQDGEVKVRGNLCPKGKSYAEKECTNPTRIVTTSVFVDGGELDVVSVKTERDVPKGKIFEILDALKDVRIQAPVKIGDIIVKNIVGTGVSIIATKEINLSI